MRDQVISYRSVSNSIISFEVVLLSQGVKRPGRQFCGKLHVILRETDISRSMEYFYKNETELVKRFNKLELLKKISGEKAGILISRSRIVDGQRFQDVGGLEDFNVLADFYLKLMTPLLDRCCPLAYFVGYYIHTKVS